MASLIPAEVMMQALARRGQIQTVPTGAGQVNPQPLQGMFNPAMRLQTAAALGRQGQTATPQMGTGRPGPLTNGVQSQKMKALLLDAYGADEDTKKKFGDYVKDNDINPAIMREALQAHHQTQQAKQAALMGQQKTQQAEQLRQHKEQDTLQQRQAAAQERQTARGEHEQEHEHDQQLHNLQHQQSLAASSFDQDKVADLQRKIDEMMKPKVKLQPKSAVDNKKLLDKATAMQFYQQAGGDPDKARALANAAGY